MSSKAAKRRQRVEGGICDWRAGNDWRVMVGKERACLHPLGLISIEERHQVGWDMM